MPQRPATLRFALALLALVGQVVPLLALPVLVVRPWKGTSAGCLPGSCACAPVDRALTGCCCSPRTEPPEPARKTCCDTAAKSRKASCCESKPNAPEPARCPVATSKSVPKIAGGGKCRCEKPSTVAPAEPAVCPEVGPPFACVARAAFGPAPTGPPPPVVPAPPPFPPPRTV